VVRPPGVPTLTPGDESPMNLHEVRYSGLARGLRLAQHGAVGEDRTDQGRSALTIRQAAALLRVHPNTVRNRIKSGRYRAEKVITENGETYVIPRSELEQESPANNLSTPSNNLSTPSPIQEPSQPLPNVREAMQAALEPFIRDLGQVREDLGREKVLRAQAEERIRDLEAELVAFREREDAEAVEEAPSEAEAQDELGAERARREMAESTLHEGMAEQRRRREEAERERDDLRRELHARGRQQGSHEATEEQQGRGQPQSATGGAQQGARRPWWRRVLRR
jgi:excisionase family DNA binding protein